MDDDTRKKLEDLSRLYDLSGVDWVLETSSVLTEPTCPTAWIQPEGQPSNRYRVDRDTIDEAIAESVERAHREWIRGEAFEGFEFWSQADCPVERLLAEARAAGRIGSATAPPPDGRRRRRTRGRRGARATAA